MTADPIRWTWGSPDAATAFAAQAARHDREGHPLADIIASPGGESWKL